MRGTMTKRSAGMPNARLLAMASPSNRPEMMGTAGLPIRSTSIMSWTIHDAHVPQSPVAPMTASHSSAACLRMCGGFG